MAVRIAHMKDSAPATATVPANVHGHDMLIEVLYAGLVVETGEHNGYDDSDFYAVVWSEGSNDFIEYTYGTTRAWTYGNSAEVDAPAALVEKYHAKCRKEAAARELERRKRDVTPGAYVVVVKGRKVPKGTNGVVVWYGPDRYKRGEYRCGVEFDGMPGKTFVAAKNLERVV